MTCLLVSQYQQTGPMVPNKFFPFFSAFVIPAALQSSEINLFPFGCGHVILEINKPFHMNRFQGSKSEFNLDLFDFFTFIKLLPYLIGIPFIKISMFSKLEFCGNKFCGWPKIFRNSQNEISRFAKSLGIRRNYISRFVKNIAKPQNFLPAKISDNKVIGRRLIAFPLYWAKQISEKIMQ